MVIYKCIKHSIVLYALEYFSIKFVWSKCPSKAKINIDRLKNAIFAGPSDRNIVYSFLPMAAIVSLGSAHHMLPSYTVSICNHRHIVYWYFCYVFEYYISVTLFHMHIFLQVVCHIMLYNMFNFFHLLKYRCNNIKRCNSM